jgi:hypothetical protein
MTTESLRDEMLGNLREILDDGGWRSWLSFGDVHIRNLEMHVWENQLCSYRALILNVDGRPGYGRRVHDAWIRSTVALAVERGFQKAHFKIGPMINPRWRRYLLRRGFSYIGPENQETPFLKMSIEDPAKQLGDWKMAA